LSPGGDGLVGVSSRIESPEGWAETLTDLGRNLLREIDPAISGSCQDVNHWR
jgi:hypothetical protein